MATMNEPSNLRKMTLPTKCLLCVSLTLDLVTGYSCHTATLGYVVPWHGIFGGWRLENAADNDRLLGESSNIHSQIESINPCFCVNFLIRKTENILPKFTRAHTHTHTEIHMSKNTRIHSPNITATLALVFRTGMAAYQRNTN